MSLVELEAHLASLKDRAEGDFADLVLHLEAASQHLQASHIETLVKDAVFDSLKHVAIKANSIANNWVLPTVQEVEAVATATEKVVRKATSRKQSTT